jgi:hypothetical protein
MFSGVQLLLMPAEESREVPTILVISAKLISNNELPEIEETFVTLSGDSGHPWAKSSP